jgi:hypothetical protein
MHSSVWSHGLACSRSHSPLVPAGPPAPDSRPRITHELGATSGVSSALTISSGGCRFACPFSRSAEVAQDVGLRRR